MQSTAALGNQPVVEDYDFCKYSRVVDMGGGTGGLMKLLLPQCPNTTGVIFELPEVWRFIVHKFYQCSLTNNQIAQDGEAKWKVEFPSLLPRASFVPGSFFESAPSTSEFIRTPSLILAS